VFRLFSLTQRHILEHAGEIIRTFEPQLTNLQRQVLDLLDIPEGVYKIDT
jgi:hypothetical protein